ncbi:MAG: hypothetical protein AAF846_28560 [Chloroflexota bacterium]
MTEQTEQTPPTIGIDGQPLIDEYQAYRKWGARMIIAGFLLLTVSAVVSAWWQAESNIPIADDIGKLGVHLLLDDGRNRWDSDLWTEHIAYADAISSENGIAVQVIRSDDLSPERWQQYLDLAEQHQLTPVLRLATTFDFENGWWTAPTPDADGSYVTWGENYADFLNSLTWYSDQKYVILLNEPNNGHEWGGNPDPEAYAQFVVGVASVLREQVEDIVILNGAFDLNLPNTNGQPFPNSNVVLIDANTFLERMEASEAGIFNTFDIWNSHPYPLDIRAHPSQQVYRFDAMNGAEITAETPPDGIYNRGINGYEWELWKLAQLGYDNTHWQIMITETGWRHNNPVNAESADSAPDYPSPEQIADFFQLAFMGDEDADYIGWLQDERVLSVAIFALNGVHDEWSHTNLLQVDANGNILGQYAHYDALATIADTE